jgi:hypothetical protein
MAAKTRKLSRANMIISLNLPPQVVRFIGALSAADQQTIGRHGLTSPCLKRWWTLAGEFLPERRRKNDF